MFWTCFEERRIACNKTNYEGKRKRKKWGRETEEKWSNAVKVDTRTCALGCRKSCSAKVWDKGGQPQIIRNEGEVEDKQSKTFRNSRIRGEHQIVKRSYHTY